MERTAVQATKATISAMAMPLPIKGLRMGNLHGASTIKIRLERFVGCMPEYRGYHGNYGE
jgi:hypothetical protein